MAKAKVSVTLDPKRLAQAQELFGATPLSQLIDVALDRLIVDELERRHASGYRRRPAGADEVAWAEVQRDQSQVADDIDWAHLYGLSQPG